MDDVIAESGRWDVIACLSHGLPTAKRTKTNHKT